MARLPKGYTKRSDGRIQYAFSKDGKRYYICANSVKECEQKADELKERMKAGLVADKKNVTLSAYYQEWKERRKGIVKPATEYTQERRFKKIEPELGYMKLVKIERRHVFKLQQTLKSELTTSGTNLIITLLHSILQSAADDGIIPRNPSDGVKALKRTEDKAAENIHRPLSEYEVKTFFKYASDSWYYDFFRFLIQTGMRSGEAAALQWNDIDFKSGVIHITKTLTRVSNNEFTIGEPKTTGSIRDIPLTDSVKDILKSQKQKQSMLFGSKITAIDSLIFTTSHHSYITATSTSNIIKNICDNATKNEEFIERFSAHGFRHTFASRAVQSGMSVKVLEGILGHGRIQTTMDIYVHTDKEQKADEMNRLHIAM